MIKSIKVSGLACAPHLESSTLMTTHNGALRFSTKKPNVVVGPNGAGKSALLSTLAKRFVAYATGRSVLSGRLVGAFEDESVFTGGDWRTPMEFMRGLTIDTDNAAAIYYRPKHIPGNDDSVTAAMMCGYFEEAKDYARKTGQRSDGQGAIALQEQVLAILKGTQDYPAVIPASKAFSAMVERARKEGYGAGQHEKRAALVNEIFLGKTQPAADARPLVLMDEPEQSLDAAAEIELWRAIGSADCGRLQVIVATHSLLPILHPDRFHLIEAVPGYAQCVRDLMAGA